MNANELADELSWSEMDTDEIETWTKEAVTMLRKQQEKINKYELRNIAQCDRIAILEAQVYGGTTK